MTGIDRKYAWAVVKSAIRSYAKDPTDQHAQQVEAAWREIRRTESLSHWRDWQAVSHNASNSSGRSRRVQ
jgi:hypothetical protein